MSFLKISLSIFSLMFNFTVYAFDVPVTVSGTLVATPCVVNGGKAIDVNFGDDLLTTRVSDSYYTKDINYSLECDSVMGNFLTLRVKGEASGFDANLLSTSNKNLGILFKKDSLSFSVNESISFLYDKGTPHLQATLVKRSGENLDAGVFNGVATLMIGYQ
ncbi:fimbrial protein [Pseudomonas graminis]